MAKFVLKDTKTIYGGRDLTGELSQMGLEYAAATPECTAFGDGTVNRAPGLMDVSAAHQGYWDSVSATDSLDKDLFDEIGAAQEHMSFSPAAGALGDIGFSFPVLAAEYVPGASIGELFAFTINVTGKGILVRGSMMENSAFTVTADGTARQVGAALSTDTIYSIIHVTAISGTSTPTLTATLESDATNSFSGSETLRISHTAITAVSAERKTLVGAVTDTWWRYTMTVSGSGPSLTAFVILGIQPTVLP